MRSVRRGPGGGIAGWRGVVCLPMMVILPVSLQAQDAAAMLRSNGTGILVNKNSAPSSTALFPDDLVETQANTVARIEISGSTADIGGETVVQFQPDELSLDHGTVSVSTARALRVRVGCIVVTPAHEEWTQYQVTDRDGKVTVSALKDDVNIDTHSSNPQSRKQPERTERVSVREGEQKSREEKCGGVPLKDPAKFPILGPWLNSPLAIGIGSGLVAIPICYALCSRHNDPVSPWTP